jgi:histidinol-phosphatase (PHP family)
MGGKFTLSDDSHGIAQVGTNFGRAIEYLESLGVKEVYTFERSEATESGGEKGLSLRGVPLALVKETFIPA